MLVGVAIGAALSFFLDEQSGRERRVRAREQAAQAARTFSHESRRFGRVAAPVAAEAVQRARHPREESGDRSLRGKVTRTAFRPWLPLFAAGVACGAVLSFFLDGRLGRRRRRRARDRAASAARKAGRKGLRASRYAGSLVYGTAQKARHRREEPRDYDDWTLTDKVKSELFRDPEVPKEHVSINAEHGIVVLRGEVPRPEDVSEYERRVKSIPGVRDVENRLHPAGVSSR
jgi:osmotically-inducible protein OsmY